MEFVDISTITELTLPRDHLVDYVLLVSLMHSRNPSGTRAFAKEFDNIAEMEVSSHGNKYASDIARFNETYYPEKTIKSRAEKIEATLRKFSGAKHQQQPHVRSYYTEFGNTHLTETEAAACNARVCAGYVIDRASVHAAYIGAVELFILTEPLITLLNTSDISDALAKKDSTSVGVAIDSAQMSKENIKQGLAFREDLIARGAREEYRFAV